MQQEATFSLLFDGQAITVRYRPEYFSNYDHIEFFSPHRPARPIPTSATGYRSHFAPNHEVTAAPSLEAYVHKLLCLLSGKQAADSNQLDLF